MTHVGLALNVPSYHFGFCVRDSSTPEAQCGVLRHGCDRDNLYGFETIPLLRILVFTSGELSDTAA